MTCGGHLGSVAVSGPGAYSTSSNFRGHVALHRRSTRDAARGEQEGPPGHGR